MLVKKMNVIQFQFWICQKILSYIFGNVDETI